MIRVLTGRRFYQYLLFLMIPGLSLKRWFAVGAISLSLLTLGVIFSLKISTGPTLISLLETISLRNESPYLRGIFFIGLGVSGTVIASVGLTRSLGRVGNRTRHWPILDSLYRTYSWFRAQYYSNRRWQWTTQFIAGTQALHCQYSRGCNGR
jgi:hypothetical protein